MRNVGQEFVVFDKIEIVVYPFILFKVFLRIGLDEILDVLLYPLDLIDGQLTVLHHPLDHLQPAYMPLSPLVQRLELS